MSALPPKADIRGRDCNVCFVPIADIAVLLDPPVLNERGSLWPGFWGRKFCLRSKRGVTFCLPGNAQKGLRQIFKLGPNCLVAFGFGFDKKA
jgi:hypothetical protein